MRSRAFHCAQSRDLCRREHRACSACGLRNPNCRSVGGPDTTFYRSGQYGRISGCKQPFEQRIAMMSACQVNDECDVAAASQAGSLHRQRERWRGDDVLSIDRTRFQASEDNSARAVLKEVPKRMPTASDRYRLSLYRCADPKRRASELNDNI